MKDIYEKEYFVVDETTEKASREEIKGFKKLHGSFVEGVVKNRRKDDDMNKEMFRI